jgi:hypothetical protein
LELPSIVLALSLTILTICPAPQRPKFLSSAEGKLPPQSHALVAIAVALNLLYNLRGRAHSQHTDDGPEQQHPPAHCDLVSRLHKVRNRLLCDRWGFNTDVPISHSALYASFEIREDQNEPTDARQRKRLRLMTNTSELRLTCTFCVSDNAHKMWLWIWVSLMRMWPSARSTHQDTILQSLVVSVRHLELSPPPAP